MMALKSDIGMSFTFSYHLFILKRLIYVLVLHKKSSPLIYFSHSPTFLTVQTKIAIRLSQHFIKPQYKIANSQLPVTPILSQTLSTHAFHILSNPLHYPHLNYTTHPTRIVEQIVNILPPTSSLYLSQSQNPQPISLQFMQQPSAQITIFFQPRPAKSKLVKLRLCILLFISPSPYLSFTPKSAPKLSKN